MRRAFLVLALLSSLGCDDDKFKSMTVASAKPKPSETPLSPVDAKPAPVAAPSSSAPPEQIVCQNILVAWAGAQKAPRRVTRTKAEAKKRAELVASLAKESPDDFDDLVKKWSDDPSVERLGTTGLIKKTDVVKPFADAAWALGVGQVSGVVESPFGFHVIKRTQ